MRGSYSKTVLSDRKTRTEVSGRSFMDLTDTFGAESKESPLAEKSEECEFLCLRMSPSEH